MSPVPALTVRELTQRVKNGTASPAEALQYAKLQRAFNKSSGGTVLGKANPYTVSTRREVAAFFGVTQQAIDKWLANGMPTGGRSQYDLQAIAQWRIAKMKEGAPASKDDEAIKKEKLKGVREKNLREEQERLKAARELLPADEVNAEFARMGTEVRTALLAVPARVVKALDGKTDAEKMSLLDSEIRAALAVLANRQEKGVR